MKNAKKKKVIIGMSAGVDSSVSAALLKNQGYDVIGVFMHFWKEPIGEFPGENKCCSLESQEDARKIAQKIGIPLYTLNAAKEFKKEVVDYFLNETRNGRTPNPCVACNEKIKFPVMMRKLMEIDADYVATGHYAQIKELSGRKLLAESKDRKKDQTYFLYTLTSDQLQKVLFPIGGFEKKDVRRLAKEMDLPMYDREESQGLCFTSEKYPNDFIKRNLKLKEGIIRTTEGQEVGFHQGLEVYTIGQRRGMNIGGNGPYFVVDKNFEKNELVVTNDSKSFSLSRKNMEVKLKNLIIERDKFPMDLLIRIRHRHQLVSGKVSLNKDVAKIEFVHPVRAITPGQSAVFYSKEGYVFGGGTIM